MYYHRGQATSASPALGPLCTKQTQGLTKVHSWVWQRTRYAFLHLFFSFIPALLDFQIRPGSHISGPRESSGCVRPEHFLSQDCPAAVRISGYLMVAFSTPVSFFFLLFCFFNLVLHMQLHIVFA